MLITSPGPLRINEIQKPSLSRVIPHLRRFQVLYGLGQDRGVIQRRHLLIRPDLGQEVLDLETSQVL